MNPEKTKSDQWMVRTSQNLIHGPYNQKEICEFIQSGKLTTLDEVCQASGYWFFLHEAGEVQRHLGVNPPLPAHNPEDEITETEVRTGGHLEAPHPSLSDPAETEVTPVPASQPKGGAVPEREMAASEALKRAIQRSQDLGEGTSRPTNWSARMQGISFWKGLTIFLVAVGVVLFLSILRLVHNT